MKKGSLINNEKVKCESVAMRDNENRNGEIMKVKCMSAKEFSECEMCIHSDEHEEVDTCSFLHCYHTRAEKPQCLPLDEQQKRNL